MALKKTLLGILLAAGIGGLGLSCNHQAFFLRQDLGNISQFENNNSSLDDMVINEVAKSVEQVNVSARYHVEYQQQSFDDELEKHGSGTVLSEANGNYYILTANHLVELPGTESSSTAEEFPVGVKPLAELIAKPATKEALFASTATVSMVGERLISISNIAGGKVIYSNPQLDYAIITVPSNGQLKPLSALHYSRIGDSRIVEAADYTYTIGYSLSLGRFITAGNVSSKDWPMGTNGLVSIKRTDAFTFTSPISPGNSGGPVFTIADHKLYLSGMVVNYFSDGQNLNIAIKINDIIENVEKQQCLQLCKIGKK